MQHSLAPWPSSVPSSKAGSDSTAAPPTLLPQAFLPSLLGAGGEEGGGLHLEALVHGNIRAGDATDLARRLWGALGGSPLAADQRPAERCVQLPKGCHLLNRCGAV